ncbi:hypothetical protein BT69DRAFT_1287618, partial [Atractiella rhizophila]
MDSKAPGGAKNIVDLTGETVKGDPDILASKELQVRLLMWFHGGLRDQWGDALKIVRKEFWNETASNCQTACL